MARDGRHAPYVLNEIEHHVAWLYATAVQVSHGCDGRRRNTQHRELTGRIVDTTQALKQILPRVPSADIDADEAVELAVVLGRALKAWNRARMRWQSKARATALVAAATELATIGVALEEALASVPWVGEDDFHTARLHARSSRKIE
jgi:hypothetical protein